MTNDRWYLIFPVMAFIRFIITMLSIVIFSTKGCAQYQEKDTAVVWDLEKCIRYAKEHNIRISRLKLDQKISEQELQRSHSARTPELYASATQFVTHRNTAAINAGNGGSGTFGSGDYGLNSSIILYSGGYLSSDIRQKNLLVEAANLSILQQENDVTLQVIQYYLNILLDKENIIYAQSAVNASTAQVVRARNQLAAGSIARKELLQLEAQLANDKYSVIISENAKRQDLINLKQLLQLSPETKLDIPVPDSLPMQLSPEKLSEVQEQALNSRPEVKNGIVNIEIAKAGLAKAFSGYKPTLTLSGFIGSGYTASSPGYFRQLSDNFAQQSGITLSVPISTRRFNAVNVAQARINVEQARLNLKDIRTSLSLTVERAYVNLINAQSQFEAAAEAFHYNQETYRVADEQLNTGLIGMVEYLQQKTLYIQARQQFLQAKYNAALTYEIYEFYRGDTAGYN